MRISRAGLACITRTMANGNTGYLCQWNASWQRFSLIGGHVEEGESYRECCIREVAEELEIAAPDYIVATEPMGGLLRYEALSGSTGQQTHYEVQLYSVQITADAAWEIIDRNSENRWITLPEIQQLQTTAGEAVAGQVPTVLNLAGIL